jgi:exopolyphosphatase/guanosine-5'-triphosphate,3'-diphosphate pyrophosphatase
MAQNVASAPAPQTRHEPAIIGPPERRAAQPHKQQQRHTYGALDLGTNNCRLLIARPNDGGFTVIDAFSRIVRLGDGLSRSGKLSDEAMDRAVGALAVCA